MSAPSLDRTRFNSKPSILLVVVDDAYRLLFAAYGSPLGLTPAIDAIALSAAQPSSEAIKRATKKGSAGIGKMIIDENNWEALLDELVAVAHCYRQQRHRGRRRRGKA